MVFHSLVLLVTNALVVLQFQPLKWLLVIYYVSQVTSQCTLVTTKLSMQQTPSVVLFMTQFMQPQAQSVVFNFALKSNQCFDSLCLKQINS